MAGVNCPECLESWAADECLPCWDPPDFKCPCLDFTEPAHELLWAEAWRVASSYVFNCTGQLWPGKCLTETVRPCIPVKCPPACRCYDCGRYNYLNLSQAFCWPICEVTDVTISPNACLPDGAVWTEGDGFRIERVMGSQRLVIEDPDGCCGTFPRQDLCKPMGESCTWSITARTGCNPPPEILRGTAAFACDIAQQCIETKCGLPRNATQASFNGVTVNYDEGRGKTIELQMLRDLLDKYEPKPVEQFLNTCDPVTFHHTDGPRLDPDAPGATPCVDPADFPLAAPRVADDADSEPLTTEPPRVRDSLGVHRVSPVR